MTELQQQLYIIVETMLTHNNMTMNVERVSMLNKINIIYDRKMTAALLIAKFESYRFYLENLNDCEIKLNKIIIQQN